MRKISLIVPCYNEEEALPIFYGETKKVMESMACDYELIFVNDGSKDGTLALLKELADADEHVSYIGFSRNFGKEAAMYAGFCNAGGDYVAVMDADMQDPPSLLPQMLEILETGEYDSVATRRVTRKGEPKIRSWFARMFYRIINHISDADIVDGAPDFSPGMFGSPCQFGNGPFVSLCYTCYKFHSHSLLFPCSGAFKYIKKPRNRILIICSGTGVIQDSRGTTRIVSSLTPSHFILNAYSRICLLGAL